MNSRCFAARPLAFPLHWTFVLAAAVAVLVTAGAGGAQTWEFEYDASLGTLPSAQGFIHLANDPPPSDGLDETNYSVAAGLLIQGPTGGGSSDDGNRQWYELTSQPMDFDDDVIVVEFSLRIISSTINPPPGAGPRAGFGVSVADRETQRVIAYVGSGGAFLYGSDSATSPFVGFDATDAVHDYVLRIAPTGASLELDGAEIATLDRADYGVGNAVPDKFSIGDLTILQRSRSELEGFRINRRPTPVPEVRNYQAVTEYSANDSTSTKSLTAVCPAGTVALTGGASTSAGPDVGISESYPGAGTPPTSWVGSARELVDTPTAWDLRVDVVCGEVSGYERLQTVSAQTTDAQQFGFLECNGAKRPFSGGIDLSGASLRQVLKGSHYSETFVTAARWQGNVADFGSATSSSPWSMDVHTICSDASRQEYQREQTGFVVGTPKSIVVNCLGGKLPIGGGAFGGDGGLVWSRPKDGAPGEPPVGWDAQARGTSTWTMAVDLECAPLAEPTVSTNGLRARFKAEFDAYDSWGWAHGTLNNGVGFDPGVEGQAFSFDGTNERWVSIPSQTFNEFDAIDMYPEGDFTAGAWIKTSASSVEPMTIAQLYDPGGVNPAANWSTWILNIQPSGMPWGYLRSANGPQLAATIVNGPSALNDGQWHHVAMSRDLADDSLYLYVDGVQVDAQALVGTSDEPLTPGAPGFGDPVSIGALRDGGAATLSREFDGEIDDFTYWNRAITLEEVQNVAGCHRYVGPRVLNLDADRFTSPVGADHTLCVYLEAGPQTLTLVDPVADPAARHTGWSPGPTAQWGTVVSVDPAVDAGFTFGLPLSEPNGQDAYDNTVHKEVGITLSQPQRVYFSLVDTTTFDNRGGVSIRVPEPGLSAGLLAGATLLAALRRRRRMRGSNLAIRGPRCA